VSGKLHPETAVNIYGTSSKIEGGRQLFIQINTPELWCEYYDVEVLNGRALLFKGVKDGFRSDRGGDYTPGTIPICPDWDGGEIECGKGYHLSPHPQMTKEFCTPTHFIAGWVNLSDMAVHEDGQYPQKCKIHKYAAPVWECDVDGKPIEVQP
jgi:hypothetical protein